MMGYIENKNKAFQAILRADDTIRKRRFPIVTQYIIDENNFISRSIKRIVKSDDKIIEMGCGSCRLLKMIKKGGFNVSGFDNGKLFINYCRDQGLNVFLADATKKLPSKLKGAYKIAIISFNTLFNFTKNERKKWIKGAAYLLARNGFLIFTVYAKTKQAYKTVGERVKFYNYVIKPSGGAKIKFSQKPKTKIELIRDKKILWFSEWVDKKKLIKETNHWDGFKLNSLVLLNKLAFGVVLKKN